MNPPLLSRRLLGVTAAVALVHFAISLALVAASLAFQTTLVKWACTVLTQPASGLVQLVPGELSPSLRWAAFGANSLLWGFCIALIGGRWISKRAAVATVVFLVALVLTVAGMLLTSTDAEWLGLAVAPIWAATLLTNAYVFPDIIGEVATPIVFLIGIVLNAAFLTALVFIAVRITGRLRRRGGEGLT